jgi:sorbose reductase
MSQVTGGCGGLGFEAARGLLRQGSPGVALLDLDPVAASSAVQQLASDFPSAKVITKKIDVTDADNIATVMSEARHELGSIDILLCFAGVVCTEPSLNISPQLFRRTIDVNTTGSFLCAQAVAR